MIIQKEVYGKDYCDLDYIGLRSREKAIENQKKKYNFKKIEVPVIGCAVVMYNKGIPSHIGTYIGDKKVIHSKAETGVIIEEVNKYEVEGYYEDISL